MPADALARRAPPGEVAYPGEYRLTWDDFSTIRATLLEDAGIVLDDGRVPLVYSRLAKRLRAMGLESFRDYCALLSAEAGADERMRMVASLTTNVTRFFREPHHFDHFRTAVLPGLAAKAARGEPVRIWSAGCSTGQEPYSIALTVLGSVPEVVGQDLLILASDIDPNVIETALGAEYDDALVAEIPAALRRGLRKLPDGRWALGDQARSLVRFRELNLIGAWPMRRPFDVIFCRNVVIYFGEETQERLWSRYADALRPGGTLYIGHSERLAGAATSQFRTTGLTTYQKIGPSR